MLGILKMEIIKECKIILVGFFFLIEKKKEYSSWYMY